MKKIFMGLMMFVKNECANYYDEVGCVIRDVRCLLSEGNRCEYFEKSVLGKPDYPYRQKGYNFSKLFDQYAAINSNYLTKQVKVRKCRCGETLRPRQRVCQRCAEMNRKLSYRESKRKMRKSSCLDVHS
jgi:hypothetical protein